MIRFRLKLKKTVSAILIVMKASDDKRKAVTAKAYGPGR